MSVREPAVGWMAAGLSGAQAWALDREGRMMTRRTLLVAVCTVAGALLVAACGSGARLTGTSLGKTTAPDFTLRDATGAPLRLSDLRGQTILLTFLYTHCPDVCPALAGKLAEVNAKLGSARKKVTFVAVSVDPTGDTPESVQAFTSDHGLTAMGTRWRYGLGSEEQLSSVWKSYYVGASPRPAALSGLAVTGSQPIAVDHEALMYLIDAHGRERTLLRPDISISDLVSDLKTLASE